MVVSMDQHKKRTEDRTEQRPLPTPLPDRRLCSTQTQTQVQNKVSDDLVSVSTPPTRHFSYPSCSYSSSAPSYPTPSPSPLLSSTSSSPLLACPPTMSSTLLSPPTPTQASKRIGLGIGNMSASNHSTMTPFSSSHTLASPTTPKRPRGPARSVSFCATEPGMSTYALASAGSGKHLCGDKKTLMAPPLERTLSSIGVEGNHSGSRMAHPLPIRAQTLLTYSHSPPPSPPLSPVVPVPTILIQSTSPPRGRPRLPSRGSSSGSTASFSSLQFSTAPSLISSSSTSLAASSTVSFVSDSPVMGYSSKLKAIDTLTLLGRSSSFKRHANEETRKSLASQSAGLGREEETVADWATEVFADDQEDLSLVEQAVGDVSNRVRHLELESSTTY